MRNLLIVFTLGFFCVGTLCISGCSDISQQAEDLKKTSRKAKRDLRDIQNRGAIDFETRAMLETVYKAYTSFIQSREKSPSSWADLAGAPNLNSEEKIHIRTAAKQLHDIVWGAELKDLSTLEKASAKLASMPNELLGNTILLQANGEMSMVTKMQLGMIPLAE